MATTDAIAPEDCLEPTWFLDADEPGVIAFAERVQRDAGATDDRETAVALFLAVRDGWRYNTYASTRLADDYRASTVLDRPEAYCIPKSVLLTTLCRAAGVPARLGFADVRNHLQSTRLRERMGTDVFVYHGYSEIWIDGAWRKASSAFNRELCERFGTKVLEFDGVHDALLHPYDENGQRHMEYVRQRGSFVDLPFEEIMATFDSYYGSGVMNGAADEAFEPDGERAPMGAALSTSTGEEAQPTSGSGGAPPEHGRISPAEPRTL